MKKRLFLPLLLILGVAATAYPQAFPPPGGGVGGGAWGAITGDLSDQTDLQAALDGKLDTSPDDHSLGINTLNVAPVDISTVLSGSTYTLVPNTKYYGTVTGNKTFEISPALNVADVGITLEVQVTGTGTWTVPTLIREGATGSTTTVSVGSTGYFTASFNKDGAGNIRMKDDIPQGQKGYLELARPQRVDGTGALYQNSDASQVYFGQGKFSNSADQAGNFVEYRIIVPEDLDTSVDLRAKFEFRLSNTDTGKHRYVISVADVPDSSSSAGVTGNSVNLDFAGDASGASGDIETVGLTTLTGWKSALTPGHHMVIRIARDGDDGTNDTSTVDSYSGPLEIEYQKTP
jgi:hypothetical protein